MPFEIYLTSLAVTFLTEYLFEWAIEPLVAYGCYEFSFLVGGNPESHLS